MEVNRLQSPAIGVKSLAGAIGAEISGANLSKPLDVPTFEVIQQALLDRHVVVFRDQQLSRRDQLQFARYFGDPETHPIANGMEDHPEVIRVLKPAGEAAFFGTSWHSDNSFFEKPTAMTILYGEKVPEVGGDTVFASMERAWETLSAAMRAFLEPLVAVHSASNAYDPKTTGDAKYKGEAAITYTYSDSIYDEVEHPVVRTHPKSGRKSLFVNPMFTQRILGLNPNESKALLEMLFAHATRPDFTCRVSWKPGSVTVWDNRCVQHYAIDDYAEFERVMYRVTVSGDRPR
jgi:taurine dioxygenase